MTAQKRQHFCSTHCILKQDYIFCVRWTADFSKATELRKDYAEEVQRLLDEDKQAEAQIERSRQAEAANLEMSFRVREASQDSPEELEKLKNEREQALAEMFKDLQAQRDIQKANIQRQLERAKAVLEEKQEQLRRQF